MPAKVKFDADNKPLKKANEENTEGANKTASAYKRVSKEAQEVNRLVTRGAREAETATEKWKRQTDLLNKAFKQGKINQKELTDGLALVNREVEDLGDNAETAGTAFGGMATKALAVAGSVVSFGNITAALRDISEQANEAGDQLLELVSTQGQLQQLAPSRQQALSDASQRFFSTGGIDRAAANRFAFNLESLVGVSDESSISTFERLIENRAVTGEALNELVSGVSQFNQNFRQSGGTAAVISKGFAAAEFTPATIQQLLPAAGLAASPAKQAGITDEDTLASVAVLSKSFGSAERAGVRFERFLGAAQRNNIQGDTVSEIVAGFQNAIRESGKTAIATLGSKEAVAAFTELSDSENRATRSQLVEQLQSEETGLGALGKVLGNLSSAPRTLTSAISLQEAQSLNTLSRDDIGSFRNEQRAVVELTDALRRSLGDSEFVSLGLRGINEAVLALGGKADLPTVSLLQRAEQAAKTDSEIAGILSALLEVTRASQSSDERRRSIQVPTVPQPEAN